MGKKIQMFLDTLGFSGPLIVDRRLPEQPSTIEEFVQILHAKKPRTPVRTIRTDTGFEKRAREAEREERAWSI